MASTLKPDPLRIAAQAAIDILTTFPFASREQQTGAKLNTALSAPDDRKEILDVLAELTTLLTGEDIAATSRGEEALSAARAILAKYQA